MGGGGGFAPFCAKNLKRAKTFLLVFPIPPPPPPFQFVSDVVMSNDEKPIIFTIADQVMMIEHKCKIRISIQVRKTNSGRFYFTLNAS